MAVIQISAREKAARVRAAVAYSGKQKREIVQELRDAGLAMSASTLWRRLKLGHVQSTDELLTIADICHVPRAFMLEGFSRYEPDEAEPILGRLVNLELQVSRLIEMFRELADRQTVEALAKVSGGTQAQHHAEGRPRAG